MPAYKFIRCIRLANGALSRELRNERNSTDINESDRRGFDSG